MDCLTPREYCASRRSLPFGEHRMRRGVPDWRKVGRGLIAVTDGSEKQYVVPGLIFGIELSDSNVPEICTYWRVASDDKMKRRFYDRPYALSTIRRLVAERKIVRSGTLNYDELARHVRSVYHNCWLPPLDMFALEYDLVVRIREDAPHDTNQAV